MATRLQRNERENGKTSLKAAVAIKSSVVIRTLSTVFIVIVAPKTETTCCPSPCSSSTQIIKKCDDLASVMKETSAASSRKYQLRLRVHII